MLTCPDPSEKLRVPSVIVFVPGLGLGIDNSVKVKVSEPGKFINLNSEAFISVEFILATLVPDKLRSLLVHLKMLQLKYN